MRPTFGQIFMGNAELMSQRSTCTRLKVGATLVKDNHHIMSGYNGSISNHAHCTDVGCLMVDGHCKRCLHAEMNVLLQCAKLGIPTNGATMYVTHYPCPDCMRHINQAGIKHVVYKSMYPHKYENEFHKGMTLIDYADFKS